MKTVTRIIQYIFMCPLSLSFVYVLQLSFKQQVRNYSPYNCAIVVFFETQENIQ